MKRFYVYLLYSPGSNRYYIGSTDNYRKRLEEHNSEFNKGYTGKHSPWDLKMVLDCGEERSEAMRIENFIKKQKSKKLIERLIAGETLTGDLAKLVRVPVDRD